MSDQKQRVRQTADGGWTRVTSDGMYNVVSGIGMHQDKRSHNRFDYGRNFRDLGQLEAAYSGNWIARQIVQVLPDDALREWRLINHREAEQIQEEEKRLNVKEHLRDVSYWARLYGGSAVVMITDQPLNQPLNIDAIQQGSLKRLVTLDRWDIQPLYINYTDPLSPYFLEPEYYSVRHGTGVIHASHVLRMDGEPLPRRLRQLNETWGDSTLRKILDDLSDVVATKSGISTLVQEANVDVIKREGLTDDLGSGQEGAITERYAMNNMMKSLINQLLLDKDSEEYERKQIAFSGLDGILEVLMKWISGAADIPMTRLFGQSAAGMDATGEGDQDNYYDKVSSEQEHRYAPLLRKLDEVLVRSTLGQYPDDYDWDWAPLYQESGAELAQQDLARAQSENLRLQDGVLKKSHVMARMANEGRYAISEEEIKEQREFEQEQERMFREELAAGGDPSAEGPDAGENGEGDNPDEQGGDGDGPDEETEQ